jgi:hypothetical protein
VNLTTPARFDEAAGGLRNRFGADRRSGFDRRIADVGRAAGDRRSGGDRRALTAEAVFDVSIAR